jgi:hypothetical protein
MIVTLKLLFFESSNPVNMPEGPAPTITMRFIKGAKTTYSKGSINFSDV